MHSAVAGVPMVLKLENESDAGINTGDMAAKEAVVVGWQTLTWTFPVLNSTKVYNRFVMLPNLQTQDTAKDYFFDDAHNASGS
mgnify:CR=1 FL=1